SMQYTHIPPTF
nr:immunoglobulin light chain junction region [Macaca mulatta]MOX51591.1 immunoglobulin light chain junction region [Macaca mulatta]MOX52288.1 immunoglobulin light chain junction region [Macaca mulatta]MOX52299.1 immunoglobulin light chain junction region [Macaca mulatta]MOX52699.1 immunoglobulin light chain junction region [Macaca mulatta]